MRRVLKCFAVMPQLPVLGDDLYFSLVCPRDLYHVGEQLLEGDLVSGGLVEGQLTVRVVEEVEPPSRYFRHLGTGALASCPVSF